MSNDNEKGSKIAGVSGAVATTGGIAVAASGSSAAAMTSALATIGSVFGGGMAAGIAITAATPIAVGGICYFAYKKFKK